MPIQDEVAKAMALLKPSCSLDKIDGALRELFGATFTLAGYAPGDPAVGRYVDAVSKGFYSTPQQILTARQRECALVALLASQGAELNLALHIFIALAADVPVDDVVDLLFLGGIYTGANLLTKSLGVASKTFDAIIQAAEDDVQGPKAVFRAIAARFPDPALDLARDRLRRLL